MRKLIVMLLVAVVFSGLFVTGVMATDSEDPLAVKNFAEFGAVPEVIKSAEKIHQIIPEPVAGEEIMIPEETVGETAEAEVPAEEIPETTAVAEEETPAAVAEEIIPEVEEDPDAPKGHNGVPLYFQNDYPNNIYGSGTIETNGCSAASLAMVATYMTGHEYLPDEIARYFGGAAENNIARLENGSKTMRLAYKKAENWHETLAAVKAGKIAIVLVDSRSVFTQSQHFVILTGMTEDGKILVNDSWRPNYDKWDCKEGLKNGFDPDAILAGYSGAWIYNKNAMPQEPYIYSEPEPVRGEPRYGIELTWEQMKLMAKVVWVEARGESKEGQQAVAEVILNRLTSNQFPDNLNDVIYGEGQFRSAKFLDKAEPYQLQYEAIENALFGPYVLPEDVYYFATTPMTSKVWGRIGGHIFCYSDY